MDCNQMRSLPELKNFLTLKAGENGLSNVIRWVYFADVFVCYLDGYKVDRFLHGGEFVVLTFAEVTDNDDKLFALLDSMREQDISALGFYEGHIKERLIQYCDRYAIPLFEMPEEIALIDLSQTICYALVMEANYQTATERLLADILDREHLNRDSILRQAEELGVSLSGKFAMVEFLYTKKRKKGPEDLVQHLTRIVSEEFAPFAEQKLLMLPQQDRLLLMMPSEKLTEGQQTAVFKRIMKKAHEIVGLYLAVGIGSETDYMVEIESSRQEAEYALKIAHLLPREDHIYRYHEQGIYELIPRIPDGKFLDQFIEDQLGALLAADEAQKGELCKTLEAYLSCNMSIAETADALFVHRNTVHYRISRITEIIGKDLSNLDVALTLKMALAIHHYRRGDEHI